MALTQEQIQNLRNQYNIGSGGAFSGTSVSNDRIKSLRSRILTSSGGGVTEGGQIFGGQSRLSQDQLDELVKKSQPNFFERVGGDIKKRGSQIGETFGKLFRGEITPLEAPLPVLGDIAGGITDIGGEVISELTPDFIKRKIDDVFQTEGGQKALEAIQGGVEAWEGFKNENPRIAEQVEGVVNIGSLLLEGKAGLEAAKGGINLSKRTLRTTVNKIDDLKNFRNAKNVRSIEDKIAPGINSREMKKIISEGRVSAGKESKLFGRKKDLVTQSKRIKRAAGVVKKRIPGANKMDDFQLANATNKEITSISNRLRPQLSRVNVTTKERGLIDDAWSTIKKRHLSDPELSTVPGFSKSEANFQRFIDEIKTPVRNPDGTFRQKNLNDIWELRKSYDDSVKANIKNAGPTSPSDLQFKKQIWLERREIFNDLIFNMGERLPQSPKKLFSEMSDLYMVRNNVINKAKIATEDIPGVLSPATIRKQLIKYGLPAALGYQILFD